MKVKIKDIRLPDSMMRQVVKEESLESLAKSIRKLGILLPLIVRRVGKVYELIAGFRRLLAAEMIGIEEVPVIVRKSDGNEAEAVKIAENREREEVNAVDEGKYMIEVMEANGWNQQDLARELGVSEALVSQRVATAGWNENTKDLVQRGKLKFSVARELEGIRNDAEKRRLVRVAVESGVTPAVAAQWKREVNRAIDNKQEEMIIDRSMKITHQPKKVYVACQMCEDPVEVEKIVYVRLCDGCHKTVKAATLASVLDK